MAETANDWAIDLKNVAKIYKGKVHALQGIEMRVRRGEVFGLLGPNGAGKSTLVKIMMTVVRPTRADGTILWQPVGHKPTLQRVGYLPEQHRFPKYLTGRQTLEFFGALAKVDRPTRKRRAGELLETVGMSDWGDRKVSTYSKGMMQRVGLAQTLMSEPDLVVLDEPTDGVDPVGRRDIRDTLLRLRDQGKTVFVNSHLLQELEMMCDRVAILVKGKVVKQGTMDELAKPQQRYEIELGEETASPAELAQRVMAALPGAFTEHVPLPPPPVIPGRPPPLGAARAPSMLDRGKLSDGLAVELEGSVLRIHTIDAAAIQPVLDALRREGVIIRRMIPVRQSLEDMFIEAVTDPATGVAMAPGATSGRGFPMANVPPLAQVRPFDKGVRR